MMPYGKLEPFQEGFLIGAIVAMILSAGLFGVMSLI